MARSSAINSMIRGADGRLFAIGADGVTTVAEANTSLTGRTVRVAERAGFDPADHEAARNLITPDF